MEASPYGELRDGGFPYGSLEMEASPYGELKDGGVTARGA